jgi:S-adenosyl-L-methionine hydrolase (adenosine-forming)
VSDAPPVISFLSDYGLQDEFVGVCKSVLRQIAPQSPIVDITHEVPAYDVRAGGLTLARSAQYLAPGVVLAIVDPGVGTDRRAVAVEVESGWMVGPDNGLLAPAVAMLGGAQRAVSLTNLEYQLEAPGATFAGRDILAPAAGYLAAGISLTELGEPIDPVTLVPSLLPLTRVEAGALVGEVLWVDHFGNVQTNVDPDELTALGLRVGDRLQVQVRDDRRSARWVRAYAEARPSELVVLIDSYGLVALSLSRDSAAAAVSARPGTTVAFGPLGE